MKGSLTETTFTSSGTKHEHSNAIGQLDVQLCWNDSQTTNKTQTLPTIDEVFQFLGR